MSFATVVKQQLADAANAPGQTTTWNGARSHASSGTARVDLFYGAARGVDKTRLEALLAASYAEDPLHTLKIVAYIRDCRGGKGERQLGRDALAFLAMHHPEHVAHNLKHFVGDFGRFDDAMALMNTPLETRALEMLRQQLEIDLKALRASEETNEKVAVVEGEDNSNATANKTEEEEKKGNNNDNNNSNIKKREAQISLCAKWIPSENKALDKKLKMNKKLSACMGLTPAQLRKMYLSPLRERLRILERYMCAREWDEISFSAVPSVAMHIHGKPAHAFERHLGDKFAEWKASLARGDATVNAKALFPYQVVSEYLSRNNERDEDELLEAQWKVLVADAALTGDLSRTLVLADVSGSMWGRPMEVAISLGLLVSSLGRDEYKDLVLTFESVPQFHHVVGASLLQRVNCLTSAPWGGSTDFAAAFRAVLRIAKDKSLAAADMPERLIVVSDMQFNQADSNYETNYAVLKREFEEAGYEVPHMVFWNVNGSISDVPAHAGAAKVSLVSGFSTAILKCVLTGVELTPLQTVLNAVIDERYDVITLPAVVEQQEQALETPTVVAGAVDTEVVSQEVDDDGVLI